MGRYEDDKTIKAPWFDKDEDVSLKTSFGFLASQRLVLYSSKVSGMSPTSEEEVQEMTTWMAKLIFEMIASWRLRARGKPYQEGQDRPTLDLSLAEIENLPARDIGYLYTEGAKLIKADDAAGVTNDADLITEKARADGLTPERFRPADADGGAIHGGSSAS